MQLKLTLKAALLVLFGMAGVLHASDVTPVLRVNWRDRPLPNGCVLVPPDKDMPHHQLMVTNSGDSPIEVALVTIDGSCLESSEFFLQGRVRWENVSGTGEIGVVTTVGDHGLQHIIDNGRFDSCVNGDSIRRSPLNGTGGWGEYAVGALNGARDHSIPFRFSLVVRIPGPGTFYFGPSYVYEGNCHDIWSRQPGEWWGRWSLGFGLLPLLFFHLVMAHFIGKRMRAGTSTRWIWMMIGASAALAIAISTVGMVALVMGQPSHVWLNCMFIGAFAGAAAINWRRSTYMVVTPPKLESAPALLG